MGISVRNGRNYKKIMRNHRRKEKHNMPHIEIKCYSGRSDDQKRKCAEKIAEDVAEILGCDLSSVSVAIKDIEKEDWKEKVWDANIIIDEEYLYKKPGYSCE